MIRKAMVVVAAFGMLFFGGLTQSADANNATCPYNLTTVTAGTTRTVTGTPSANCNKAYPYPGPFTNMPKAPVGPYGWGSLNVVAAAPAAGTGGGDAGAALAYTGSESTVIAYVGTGLIAFGAVALGSRRKFFQGALD